LDSGLLLTNCHFYFQCKRSSIHTSMFTRSYAGYQQCTLLAVCLSYLSNFSNNIHVSFVDSGIVKLVAYHTPLVEDIYHLKIIPKTTGFLLTNLLLRIIVSVVATIYSFNSIMYKVMDLVIPYRLIKNKVPSVLPFLFKILHTEHTHYFYICLKRKKQIIL